MTHGKPEVPLKRERDAFYMHLPGMCLWNRKKEEKKREERRNTLRMKTGWKWITIEKGYRQPAQSHITLVNDESVNFKFSHQHLLTLAITPLSISLVCVSAEKASCCDTLEKKADTLSIFLSILLSLSLSFFLSFFPFFKQAETYRKIQKINFSPL